MARMCVKTALFLCAALLCSCAAGGQGVEIGAPELRCEADITIEQNEELNQHLNLPEVPVRNSWCYFAPFGEELAELLED